MKKSRFTENQIISILSKADAAMPITSLQNNNLDGILNDAITAAIMRAKELANT